MSSHTVRFASRSAALPPKPTSNSTIDLVVRNVEKLRDLSPLWEMHQDGVDLTKVQWAAH